MMMTKRLKKIIFPVLLLAIATTVFLATPVFAQFNPWGQSGELQEQTGLSETSPVLVVANIIKFILGFLGFITLVLIIYAGFVWMTSNGNADRVAKAKKILVSAVVGLIIVLSSYGIASFVLNLLLDSSGGGGGASVCISDNETTCCGGSGTRTCVDGVWGACSDSFCDNYGGSSGSSFPTGAGWGESCGKTPGNCEASTTCAVGLNCDIADCTCQGPPVIDWVSPVGGFCWNKTNSPTDSACLNDNDCISITNGPGTCATSTPNGAVNSMLTIGGRYFGSATATTSAGKVYFKNQAGGDVEAKLANDPSGGNAQCTKVWSDDRAVVLVPANVADTSSIRLKRADGEEDSTNNRERGPLVPDFLKNNIIRPGLCGVSPDSGIVGKEIKYFGVNLSGASAFFGSYSAAAIPGESSVFTADLSGKTNVPNMQAGKTTTYVQKGLTNSNYYPFEKAKEGVGQPRIISFDPISGNKGQYVTIHGADFGYAAASQLGVTHRVYLDKNLSDNVNGIEASFAFPEVCSESVWSDKQIIFKVPSSAGLVSNTKYYLVISTKEWTIDSGDLLTIGNISSTFTFSSSTPLLPSLCLVSPKMGMPNITNVNLYGEYFGTKTNGKVNFYKDAEVSGFSKSSWLYNSVDKFYQVIAKTPTTAISGPTVVLQGTSTSNSLNFEVGSCLAVGGTQQDKNVACGSVCCPENSSMAGQCADTMNTCYTGGSLTSVYEWDFDTSKKGTVGEPCDAATSTAVCDADNTMCASGLVCSVDKGCTCQPDVDACTSYDLLQCVDGYFCPNSPGKCSPYQGGEGLFDTKVACLATDSSGLVYKANLNRYASSTQNCSLGATTKDVLDRDVKTFCATHNGSPRYQFKTNLSCPNGWSLALGGVCVDLVNSCNLCADNLKCVDDNGIGVCVDDKSICPNGSSCVNEKCVKDDKASCDCCCEIGKEGDCCAGLTCGGTCGNDASNDGAGLGECSGCNIGGDQAASDAACNCTGTTGKYCDMAAAGGVGVCQDCASLPTGACSDHSGTCCVDGMNGNKCTGGIGSTALDIFKIGVKDAYCSYYDCGDSCAAASTTGAYDSEAECDSVCNAPAPGTPCVGTTTPALQCVDDYCGIASPYDCYGGEQNNPADCGSCCCQVTNDPATDLCAIKNPILNCKYVEDGNCVDTNKDSANATPPSPDFGLCCGCSTDGDCGSAESTGCSTDTCCRARPTVESSVPVDDATSVCRNAKVELVFDQAMDVNSFSDNTIVVGDYGTGQCPAETQYLAISGMSDKRNIFARIYYKVIDFIEPILPTSIVNALMIPTTNNYCAIQGTVSGYTTAGDKGVLEFSPKKLLDAKRLYYVIIKGDEDLNSKTGVKGDSGVGMNGESMDAGIMFNGITYKNSHVFSFETLGDQGNNDGVCLVNRVSVAPSSYLFQKNINDKGDDDYDNKKSFDRTKDSDKVFIAKALSSDGQILATTTAYNWNWDWSSTNPVVADVVPISLPANESLIRASSSVVDGKSEINARLTITASSFGGSPLGTNLTGTSTVYVLVCDNPWPPVKNDGTWMPWVDTVDNCDIDSGACNNANFESYYCRDLGSAGTLDDLPAIGNNDSIVHGTSSLKSMSDLVKEVYFFRGREVTTGASASFNAVVNSDAVDGGSVKVSWSNVFGDVSLIKNYKIYWGLKSGSHTFSEIVESNHGDTVIDGLKNNTTYYFNMTAIAKDSGAESAFVKSTDVEVLVEDKSGLGKPAFNKAIAGNEQVSLGWNGVTGNPVKYLVYYGASSTSSVYSYGSLKEVKGETNVIIHGLTNYVYYDFAVVAVDAAGNRSATSTVIERRPRLDLPVITKVVPSDKKVSLNWNEVPNASKYVIEYAASPVTTWNTVNVNNPNVTIDELVNNKLYNFRVMAADGKGLSSPAATSTKPTAAANN